MTIEGDDNGLSEALHVTDVTVQVLQTFRQSFGIWLLDVFKCHSAMHFQTLCSGYNDNQSRLESRLAALDIEELLCTQISAEACLCHHIVTERHRHLCGDHAGASMGDISERSSMYIGRCMFCSLYQIGIEGIAHQHGNGSSHTKILYFEELSIGSDAQHDIFDTTLQIFLAGGQTEDGHQF